jgi:hypothetical protein
MRMLLEKAIFLQVEVDTGTDAPIICINLNAQRAVMTSANHEFSLKK